jgi:hypothetical protein
LKEQWNLIYVFFVLLQACLLPVYIFKCMYKLNASDTFVGFCCFHYHLLFQIIDDYVAMNLFPRSLILWWRHPRLRCVNRTQLLAYCSTLLYRPVMKLKLGDYISFVVLPNNTTVFYYWLMITGNIKNVPGWRLGYTFCYIFGTWQKK